MSSPLKMPAIQQSPNLFLRLWSWFRGLFRSQGNVARLLDAATEEATVPFSPPVVVSKRVPLADLPFRPRLLPSMVVTARLPVLDGEEPAPTTKVPTPPEPLSLPLPVSIISPRGKARLSSILECSTEETPLVSRDAATQQFHSPHLVNPTTGSKIIPPTLRNRSNVIVPIRSLVPILPEDMAPKTLVQARIQDDAELMELVEEFKRSQGEQ